MTPAQIRRLLANAEARAERLRGELATAIKEAELFRQLLELQHRDEVLQNQHDSSTINTMDAQISVPGVKLGTKHPGAVAMRKVDGSVAKFADKHGLFKTTVRSWYYKGEAARRIPRRWVNVLKAAPYRVPESAWREIDES